MTTLGSLESSILDYLIQENKLSIKEISEKLRMQSFRIVKAIRQLEKKNYVSFDQKNNQVEIKL